MRAKLHILHFVFIHLCECVRPTMFMTVRRKRCAASAPWYCTMSVSATTTVSTVYSPLIRMAFLLPRASSVLLDFRSLRFPTHKSRTVICVKKWFVIKYSLHDLWAHQLHFIFILHLCYQDGLGIMGVSYYLQRLRTTGLKTHTHTCQYQPTK